MIEVVGDLWTYPADFRVITTNGSVRKDGACVMGRGCAKEAARRYPELPDELGHQILLKGNRGFYFGKYSLFTFPVKHAWHEQADINLIEQSTAWFARNLLESATYVMPRPGCGNGHLSWKHVRPILVHLPDNVHVIDFAKR